jgi:Arv1-like family
VSTESTGNLAVPTTTKDSKKNTVTSTPSVVKLNHCTSCQNVVDPYCEREGLLVMLDLILLRTESYRHVLCNDTNWYGSIEKNKATNYCKRSWMNKIRSFKNLWRDIAISCILRVYLQVQSTEGFGQSLEELVNSESPYELEYAHQVMYDVTSACFHNFLLSVVGLFTFLVVLLLVGIHNIPDNKDDNDRYSRSFQCGMILKSALWPMLASQIATIWIDVWENSDTTRLLGCTALPLMYQWTALYHTLVVNTNSTYAEKPNDNATRKKSKFLIFAAIKSTIILAIAVIARSSTTVLFGSIDNKSPRPCPGLEVSLYSSTTKSYRICVA